MNDLAKWINIVSFLIPIVRSAVELIEQIAGNLPGQEKKNMAIEFLKSTINGIKGNPNIKIKELDLVPIDVVLMLLSDMIDVVVALFNAAIWKKK